MPERNRFRKMKTGIEKVNRNLFIKPADNVKQWQTMRLKRGAYKGFFAC